ncbi:lipid-binding protein [Pinibacter aurantiacus]|uniref:Lipid-binding hydrolase n=1 Tax=Pinibacter aurantiacus TaxID=2851599 RepID=A0A9E2SB64_9BACT|nr:lipid-binding protein [Pinibacter aurantiacus]MBV4358179.1 hypothetical protein [Pinibacter aurantiacus]
MKNIKIYLLFGALIALAGCSKESEDPGQTNTSTVSGDYWANLYVDGDAIYPAPRKITIANTASNKDSVWIDDHGSLYAFYCKAGGNMQNFTFAATNSENLYYDGGPSAPATVTITDGKVMPKAAHSTTGVVTDSIYFKVVFSDDPGTTYEIKGTGTTNWPEDDF